MSASTTPQPKLALALGGGAVRGAVHFGVLHALEHEGFEVHAIAGTSSGAIIGMLYALGKFSKHSKLEIHRLMRAIGAEAYDDLQQVFFKDHSRDNLRDKLKTLNHFQKALTSGIKTPGVSTLEPLRAKLEALVGNTDFSQTRLPLAVVATDLLSGERVVLREGRLLDAVLASSAIPGIFPPIELAGRLLVDGHVVDNIPVEVARSLVEGPSVVLAVDVSAGGDPPSTPKNAFEMIHRAAEISRQHLKQASLTKADLVIRIGDELPANNFDHTRARDLFEAGLEQGHAIAPQLRQALEALKAAPEAKLGKPERARLPDWRAIFNRNQAPKSQPDKLLDA